MIGRGTLARYVKPGSILIETGTREGNTIQEALSLGASRVLSVENQTSLYEKARKRFENDPRVNLFLGSSDKLLGAMIDQVKGRAVFWVDAHSTGKPSPILGELSVITRHLDKVSSVLIDDVRLYRQSEWKVTLGDLLNALGPDFLVHMEDGYVPYDVLVAEPV